MKTNKQERSGMENEVRHTPTPWKFTPIESWGNMAVLSISDADGKEVVHNTTSVKTAELIVRAVNSHEELISALKQALEYVKEQGQKPYFIRHAESIIAKATGEVR